MSTFEPSQVKQKKLSEVKASSNSNFKITKFDQTTLYGVNLSKMAPIARSIPAEVISGKSLDVDSFVYAAIPADMVPARDNMYSLGSSSLSWKDIYAYNYYNDAGAALSIFKTVVPTTGDNVVADTLTDTLTLTSTDGSVVITGTAASDTLNFSASTTALGSTFLKLDASNGPITENLTLNKALVVNETGGNFDIRMEGDTDINLLYLDASADTVQVGAATVSDSAKFYVAGKISASGEVEINGDLNHDGTNIGFFGVAPTTKQTALTTQLTTLTFVEPGTPDYAIQTVAVGGYGFATADEGNSVLKVIANLQTRVAELETKLQAYGLLT